MKIQRLMLKENLRIASLVALLGLASCIENDIPYPLVEGTIGEIVVEGLRASEDGTVASGVDIDRTARTVTLYVNDSVDVSRLKLTRLILDPRDATIELDSARCDDKEKFPFHDFASLDSLSLSANTRLDLSTSLELNVRTYQDNPWTLTVRQIVDRTVDVDGMVDHLVDPVSRVAMIYVSADQDLSNIKIRTLNLGGAVRTLARYISPSRISQSLTRSVPSPLSGRSSTRTTVISSPMASSSADSLPRAISRLRYPWNIVRRIVRPNISSSWRRLASTVITSSGGKAVPFG